MTYNVFSGTLNPTQSINLADLAEVTQTIVYSRADEVAL